MRLIDADELEKAIYEWMPKDQSTWMDSDLPPIENLVVSIMMTIQEQPTVDAVPVKHGRWIKDRLVATSGGTYGIRRCSVCEWYFEDLPYEFKHCPRCGARMDAA